MFVQLLFVALLGSLVKASPPVSLTSCVVFPSYYYSNNATNPTIIEKSGVLMRNTTGQWSGLLKYNDVTDSNMMIVTKDRDSDPVQQFRLMMTADRYLSLFANDVEYQTTSHVPGQDANGYASRVVSSFPLVAGTIYNVQLLRTVISASAYAWSLTIDGVLQVSIPFPGVSPIDYDRTDLKTRIGTRYKAGTSDDADLPFFGSLDNWKYCI